MVQNFSWCLLKELWGSYDIDAAITFPNCLLVIKFYEEMAQVDCKCAEASETI
jgi:hypothetical protein